MFGELLASAGEVPFDGSLGHPVLRGEIPDGLALVVICFEEGASVVAEGPEGLFKFGTKRSGWRGVSLRG